MAIVLNDNLQENSSKPLDNKYYKNGLTAYASTTEANTTIVSAYRYRGLTVAILDGGVIKEYWYYAGVTDGDLVEKLAFITSARTITSSGGTISGGGALTSNLDLAVVANMTNQKVGIRKNSSGAVVGTRKTINLIEGSNVTMTIADDSGSDEIDVTINASGGGSGGAPNIELVEIVAEGTTFTIGGIVGASEIMPVAYVFPTVLYLQATDNTPAPGELYVNTANGQFTAGTTLSAGQKIVIVWWS